MFGIVHSDFVWSTNSKIEKDYIKIRNKPHLNTLVKTKQSERDCLFIIFGEIILKRYGGKRVRSQTSFCLYYEGKPLSPGGLSSYTRKLFKKFKFTTKELSFHKRVGNTVCNTHKRDGGGSINVVSKSLGHSNTRITEEVYTDFKPHEHFNVVDYIKINVKKPK